MGRLKNAVFTFFIIDKKVPHFILIFIMPGGVIGNTSDSGSEKSRFEP